MTRPQKNSKTKLFPADFVEAATALTVVQRLFFGPPGIPDATRKVLEDAFADTAKDPEFVQRFKKSGHALAFARGDAAGKFPVSKTATYIKYADLLKNL